MATTTTTTTTTEIDAVKIETPVEHLKTILQTLTDQSSVIKSLMNTVRQVIKDSDRQSKELEKLRNKRSRVKTERSANSLPSGITKPVAITDELAKFLGVAVGTLVPRNEVTKGVSGFVKEHGLSDPANKQKFILDDRAPAKQLRVLLGNPTEDVTYFNLQRYLKHHYVQSPVAEGTVPKVKKVAVPPVVEVVTKPVAASEPEVLKKKILVKKVKKQELTEEA